MGEQQQNDADQPAEKALNLVPSPHNGIIPPVEHRFKIGNQKSPGRPKNAGSSVTEWMNNFAHYDLSESDLRKIARDKKETWARRTAANRMVRTMESGDLADFGPVVSGEQSLDELRKGGIDTDIVKKLKAKRVTRKTGRDETETEETVEMELHDRAAGAFDQVCNRTDGMPTQRTENKTELSGALATGVATEEQLKKVLALAADPGQEVKPSTNAAP